MYSRACKVYSNYNLNFKSGMNYHLMSVVVMDAPCFFFLLLQFHSLSPNLSYILFVCVCVVMLSFLVRVTFSLLFLIYFSLFRNCFFALLLFCFVLFCFRFVYQHSLNLIVIIFRAYPPQALAFLGIRLLL